MYWMFHGEENVEQVKKIIDKASFSFYSRIYKISKEKKNDIVKGK